MTVRRTPQFGQLLDEKLQEFVGLNQERQGAAAPSRRGTAPHPLLFAASFPARVSGYPRASAATARQRRVLSPRQHHALAALNRFGASLAPDFTASELRSAFRRLARRYHPDCYSTSDGSEHARLSRAFAEIVEQHRCLMVEGGR